MNQNKPESNKYNRESYRKLRANKKVSKNPPKRKPFLFFKTYLPLLIFLLLILLVSGFFISSKSKLNNVKIVTNENKNIVRNVVPFQNGDSIFQVIKHEKKAIDLIKKREPRVKRVDFILHGINDLETKITFFKTPAYAEINNKLYPVYQSGYVEKNAKNIKNKDNILILKDFRNRKEIEQILNQISRLPKSIQNNILRIEKDTSDNDNQRVKIFLRDNNQIIVKIPDIDTKLLYYPDIKTTLKQKSLINLEFGAYSTPIK